jgi:hypothetical protein
MGSNEPLTAEDLANILKSSFTGNVVIWCFNKLKWLVLAQILCPFIIVITTYEPGLSGQEYEAYITANNILWIQWIFILIGIWIVLGFYFTFKKLLK